MYNFCDRYIIGIDEGWVYCVSEVAILAEPLN